ncbi:hypothetical protein HN011_007377 [Eciton burchellii]|nr:hypothetical protein HN011_007377 [Eciton burchellii]
MYHGYDTSTSFIFHVRFYCYKNAWRVSFKIARRCGGERKHLRGRSSGPHEKDIDWDRNIANGSRFDRFLVITNRCCSKTRKPKGREKRLVRQSRLAVVEKTMTR